MKSKNTIQISLRRLFMLHARQDALKAKWWPPHVRVMKESGRTMREVRRNAGVSVRSLARLLRITAPFLSDMERGRRFYSKEWVSKAIKALERPDSPDRPAFSYKEDHRPPLGGWADGHYLRKCFLCQEGFFGDKRAVSCADCAYKP